MKYYGKRINGEFVIHIAGTSNYFSLKEMAEIMKERGL
jgi:hypothetical protein